MILFSDNDNKIAAGASIGAGLLSLACLIAGMAATQFDAAVLADPVRLLDMNNVDTGMVRAFMLFDLFGYYLLLLPVIFHAHQQLSQRTPWAFFFSAMGFGYVIVGAIGAASLAVIWPSIIEQHAVAPADMRQVLKASFTLANDFVVKGMWNQLEVLLGGVWWIGIGVFAIRERALKFTTVFMGIACLVDGTGELLRIPALAEAGLNIYLLLGIIWPAWYGFRLTRQEKDMHAPTFA